MVSYSTAWVIRTAPELTFHNCYLLLISRTIRRLLMFYKYDALFYKRHNTMPCGVRSSARIRYYHYMRALAVKTHSYPRQCGNAPGFHTVNILWTSNVTFGQLFHTCLNGTEFKTFVEDDIGLWWSEKPLDVVIYSSKILFYSASPKTGFISPRAIEIGTRSDLPIPYVQLPEKLSTDGVTGSRCLLNSFCI